MTSSFFTLDELGLRSDDDPHPFDVRAEHDDAAHSVFEIDDLATLAELETLWADLFQQTDRPAFCQTFEWLQLYWSHFGDRQRLRAFCVERGGDTVGLMVLIEQEAHGQTQLTLPSVGSETLVPLGMNSEGSWRAIGDHLRSELTRKHILNLRGLSDPRDHARTALIAAGLPVRSQLWSANTVIGLPDDFGSYWSRTSASMRKVVELGEQRFAALGPTNFVRFRPQATEHTTPQFPEELYQDCLNIALSDETQLARADSILNAPARHRFLRDLIPCAWQQAAADLCVLLVGSRPVAFRFHTLIRGQLRTIWTGADSEFQQIPLAALLLHRTLRDSTQRSDNELDLGPTAAVVAVDWNGSHVPLVQLVAGALATSITIPKLEEMMP